MGNLFVYPIDPRTDQGKIGLVARAESHGSLRLSIGIIISRRINESRDVVRQISDLDKSESENE